MRLDRDRMPVLFSVVTSVISGVIVAAILKVLHTDISTGATVVWFVAASGGVAVISWTVVTLIHHFRKPTKAFLMTSAFSQKYYVAALVQRIHSALDRDAIDLVLKVPDRDYDASSQSHHLRRILARKRDYLGGIIVAGEVHRLRDDLATFCRDSRLSVVFTDLEPFDKESEYPANSTFIGYDTGELGELAGKWLAKHLQRKKHPHVLIIASREHSSRQQRCEQGLRSMLPGVLITTNDGCEFMRSRAYDAVHAHVRQLDPGQCLDAIFCTNDEMALGAVDALSTPSPATGATLVIGIDGILEAKALIDSGRSPLRATVVQDAHRLAVNVVDTLVKMHRGHAVPKRTILNAEVYET